MAGDESAACSQADFHEVMSMTCAECGYRPGPAVTAATPATLRKIAAKLREEAGRIEWCGMGQAPVYNKGQQEGLCYAASIVERWADDQH